VGFDRTPEVFLWALGRAEAPAVVQLVQLGVSALALLPSTLLIGATFPCAVAAWGASPARVGEAVGRLCAVNTAGAIVGTVLAGFVLVPALGVHVTLQAGIVVNLLLAAGLAVAWPRPVPGRRWALFDVAVLVAAAVAFAPPWNVQVMTSGPSIYRNIYLTIRGGRAWPTC